MAIKSFLSEGGFSVGSVGSTPTEVIDASGNITAGTISGSNLTLSGNLTVNGSTTTINSTTITADDVILTLGGDTAPSSDDNKDRGIEFRWHNGTQAKVGFFGFDDSTGYFTFIPDATNTSEVFAGTQGDIQVSNLRSSNVITTGDVSANTVTAGGAYTTRITGSGSGAYIYFGTSGGSSLGQIGRFGSLMQFDSDTPFAFKYQGTDLVRIGTGGNVGIGTIAPASKLTVGPNFITSSGVTIDTNSAGDSQLVARKAASKTAFSVLAWDSASYIGSGTYYNSSAWVHHNSSNNSQLFILNPGTGLSWYASSDATVSWNVANNVTLWNDAGNWKSLVQSTASGNSSFTGGNLGVGTSSPAAPLEVVGSTGTAIFRNGSATSYGGIRIYNDQNSNGRALEIDYSGSTYASALVTSGPTGESAAITTTGAYPLVLGTSNTARVTILSGGNVGVGTIAPAQKLDVAGNVAATSSGSNPNFRAIDGSIITKVQSQSVGDTTGAIGTESNHTLKLLTNNVTRVTLDTSGNVGVGTTTPNEKLQVNDGSISVRATSGGTWGSLRFGTTNSTYYDAWAGIDSDWEATGLNVSNLRFYTAYGTRSEKMRITSQGSVGIGTVSPAYTLDVAGSIKASSGATNGLRVHTNSGIVASNNYMNFFTSQTNGWTFSAEGTGADATNQRVVITSAGSVGIGTTSPGYNLEISGAAATNGVARIGSIDYGSSTVLSVAPGVINFDAAGVVGGRFKINSSGNVGINNTTPTYKLDVGGNVRTNDWYYVESSGKGIFNNTNNVWLASHRTDGYSLSTNTTAAGLILYSGGSINTWRGWFYGDADGQGFVNGSLNWQLLVDSSSRLRVYSGIYNLDSGIRVVMPGGAAYSTNTSTITGAFKIKLPTARYKSDSMLRMTVKIYQYSTGQSLTFNIGGYNYNHATNTWLNVFAEQESDSNATTYTVRFGDDGTANCIWIGETNTVWSYPQVFVSEVEVGFSGTTSAWASGWSITSVTAFDTVYVSRTPAVKVTSNNIGTYGVSSITGTSNQVIASASTGAVTLSLPQSIHTGATPTFSTLTLGGDVLTFSGGGVSAYNTSTARIYNQAGIGPTINGANFEVRTGSSGTLGFSVNGSQNATIAGNLTVSGAGDSTIAGTLGIGGAAYYSNKLTVDGSALAIGLGVTNVRGGHVTTIVNPDGGSTSTNIALRIANSSGTTLIQSTYGGSVSVPGSVYVGTTSNPFSTVQIPQLGMMMASGTAVASYASTSSTTRTPDGFTAVIGNGANSSKYSQLVFNTGSGSVNSFAFIGSTPNSGYIGDLIFGSATGSASYSEWVRILGNNGNVGIGTTAPGHKLEVSGNALVSKLFISTANASYDLYNNGTTYLNGAVTTGGALTVGTSLTVGSSSIIGWTSGARLESPSDGVVKISSNNGSYPGYLNVGGIQSWDGVIALSVASSTGHLTANANLTVTGNLIVNGTTTTVNSTVATIKDPIVTLGGGNAGTAASSDDNKDRGIEFKWHNGTSAKTGFFGFQDSTGYLTFIPDATNTSEVFSGTLGDIQATNFRGTHIGNVTGNASTATTLQTARNIAGVSFNGSADITLTGQNISTARGTAANDIEVAKYLRWKNYGNNHVLIDASAGTEPGGGAIDRYTAQNPINSTGAGVNTWGEAISLMGWNGTNTYGVRVDRARTIDNQANSATITATSANTASQIVQRDSSGNFSAGTITATLAGLATSETLSTVTGRGASTSSQISVGTAAGGSMFTGTKQGSSYGDSVSGATFKSITENPNGGSYAFAAYYGGAPGTGTNSFFVGAGGDAYFKNNVGIGTTSPQTYLHVVNSTTDSSTAGRTTALNVITLETSNTGAQEYNGFGQGLVFRGRTYNNTTARTLGRIVSKINDDSVNTTRGTSLHFETSDNPSLTSAPTEKMVINYAGNVGIGTTSPSYKLHAYAASGTVAFFQTPGGGNVMFNNGVLDSNSSQFGFQAGSGNKAYIGANAGQHLTIDTSGNVGIGTTTPSVKLHVAGSAIIANNTSINPDSYLNQVVAGAISTGGWGVSSAIGGSGNTGHAWAIGTNSTRLYFAYGDGASTNTLQSFIEVNTNRNMTLMPTSGNVGIGTGSPGYKLTVNGAIYSNNDITAGTTGADTGLAIYHGAGSADYGRIRFYQSATNNNTIHSFPTGWQGSSFFVNSSGAINIASTSGVTFGPWNAPEVAFAYGGNNYIKNNVGIGTSSPESPLQVAKTGTDEQLILGSATTNRDISVAMYSGTTKAEVLRFQSSYRLLHALGSSITQQSFFTNGSERLTLASGGSVGIGITSNIRGVLHVNASNYGESPTINKALVVSDSANSDKYLILTYHGTPDCGVIQGLHHGTAWKPVAINPNGGYVGIGTTSPGYKLQVAGNGYFSSDLTSGGRISATGYTCELYLDSGASYSTITSYGSGVYKDLWIRTLSSSSDGVWIKSTSGNVGIGTASPGYKLEVNGSFAATTKSFVIKHPTKEGKKLRYGSLEGPENGVYVRGKLKGINTIELPDYWTKLVDPESITVNLTPIGSHQKLYVEKIEDNVVYIANENLLSKGINCFYTVFGERIDVEKLQVEIDAS